MAIRKGDLLECVDADGFGQSVLTLGAVYTAKENEQKGFSGNIVRLEQTGNYAFYVKRFRPAASSVHAKAADLIRLGEACGQLGPRALGLLVEVAERLAKGAAEHGDFEKGAPHGSWAREAAEERLDALVYETIDALERAGKWSKQ